VYSPDDATRLGRRHNRATETTALTPPVLDSGPLAPGNDQADDDDAEDPAA
jgi:hypothetical protein